MKGRWQQGQLGKIGMAFTFTPMCTPRSWATVPWSFHLVAASCCPFSTVHGTLDPQGSLGPPMTRLLLREHPPARPPPAPRTATPRSQTANGTSKLESPTVVVDDAEGQRESAQVGGVE